MSDNELIKSIRKTLKPITVQIPVGCMSQDEAKKMLYDIKKEYICKN